jgi:hypothetical protein
MLLAPTKDNSKLHSLPLPAPAEQTQSGETGGEERERGGKRYRRHHPACMGIANNARGLASNFSAQRTSNGGATPIQC